MTSTNDNSHSTVPTPTVGMVGSLGIDPRQKAGWFPPPAGTGAINRPKYPVVDGQ
jgi:hypothetical protein